MGIDIKHMYKFAIWQKYYVTLDVTDIESVLKMFMNLGVQVCGTFLIILMIDKYIHAKALDTL